MISLKWICGLALALSSSGVPAEVLTYRVTGVLNKDRISDPIYGASADNVVFEIRFEADASSVLRVPAGTTTSLPNFPALKFSENGFHFPRSALRSFSFRLSSGNAHFSLADVIGDPSSAGVIFVTGTLRQPTAAHILLANSQSGYFELGLADCALTCRLKGGIVLDQAGPFGNISNSAIELSEPRGRPLGNASGSLG